MASIAKREWTHNGEKRAAYVVRYKQGGKHRSRQFAKQKEADAFRRRIERELDDGTAMSPEARITVAQAANHYLKQLEDGVTEGSCGRMHLRSVRIATDKYLVPTIGTRIFADLRWADADRVHDAMKARGLGPVSRRKYLKYFRQIEDGCLRRGSTMKAVFRPYIAEMKTVESEPVRVLSVTEIGVLLRAAEGRPLGYRHHTQMVLRCFVHLAAFCGLRFGEIAALRQDRIDLAAGILRVDQSVTQLGEIKRPKTKAGTRQVALPRHLAEMLREYDQHHRIPSKEGFFFTTANGGRVQAAPFHYQSWRPLLDRAGLLGENVEVPHFHSLRHFCASAWIALQMPLPEVAKRIGHSKVDMTLRTYAHAIGGEEIRRDITDAMSALLVSNDAQGVRTTP